MKTHIYLRIYSIKQICLILLLMSLSLSLNATEINWVAGSKPDQRPFAPIIRTYVKNGQWYRNTLHGVYLPYPASLRFVEDQEAWYTPFNHPGMTGIYDIRGWYRR